MQQIKISSWGNSLGFRIPAGLVSSFGIQAGDILELTPVDEGLLIKKTLARGYRLADILESFTPADRVPEIDFGPAKGDEVW